MQRRAPTRENTRSSSTPPWFAQNCRSPSTSEREEASDSNRRGMANRRVGGYQGGNSRGPSRRGSADKFSSSPVPSVSRESKKGSKEAAGEHQNSSTATPETQDIRRTPQLRNTDPECEIDLPEDEDFVEGGVELSPPRDSVGVLVGESCIPPPLTRPLEQLEERQLEEFWPSGNGMKALFLDYDGTLREFEARPELAVPTQEIRDLLDKINARDDISPHIISGRNASFLEAHFGHLSRFTLVAEHGFQIWRVPDNKSTSRCWTLWDGTANHETWKSEIRSEMLNFVNEMPGSHLEEKASSLVWHYREVVNQTKAEDKSHDVIGRLAKLAEEGNLSDVRISHGHKIVEASYQKVRKGPVMRKLCEEKALFGEPYVGVLTAGDDVSDESMFDAAPSDYLTIKVGAAETSARYRVESPADVRAFLWKLVERGPTSDAQDDQSKISVRQ